MSTVQKITEFKKTINNLGNSNLEQLKEDNYSIKSRKLTIFGPKTEKWGKMFIKSNRILLVIDMPSNYFTEEQIAKKLEMKKVAVHSKETGFRISPQKDRDQLIINLFECDYSTFSLNSNTIASLIYEISKLVCR